MNSVEILLAEWVAPFGDPGIKDRSHLPLAFRSVLRPSSPLSAKASTRCPYLTLDRKTRRLQGEAPQSTESRMKTLFILPKPLSADSARWRRRRTRFGSLPLHLVKDHRPGGATLRRRNSLSSRSADRARQNGGGERDRTDDLLLAKQALSQLSYTPAFQADSWIADSGMVGQGRFEPPTSRLSSARSNQLSY